jgi:hypothetical protein
VKNPIKTCSCSTSSDNIIQVIAVQKLLFWIETCS